MSKGEHRFMNELSSIGLLNECEHEYGERVTSVGSTRNEMVEAADQVIRAAREAGSFDAERVLKAVVELIKAASGGDTRTA